MLNRTDDLAALSEKATPGPWAYRPDEFDDWGFVRSRDGKIACIAQGDDFRTHDAHRAAKTDPREPNGRFIVALVNAYRDGSLVLSPSSVSPTAGAVGRWEGEQRWSLVGAEHGNCTINKDGQTVLYVDVTLRWSTGSGVGPDLELVALLERIVGLLNGSDTALAASEAKLAEAVKERDRAIEAPVQYALELAADTARLASLRPAENAGEIVTVTWQQAKAIADSDHVMRVYAAPEFDELSDDGKSWVKAIVEAARNAGRPAEVGDAITVEAVTRVIELYVDPSGMSRSIYGSDRAAKALMALFTPARTEISADEIETLVGVWRTVHASNGGNLHATMRRVLSLAHISTHSVAPVEGGWIRREDVLGAIQQELDWIEIADQSPGGEFGDGDPRAPWDRVCKLTGRPLQAGTSSEERADG